MTYTGIIMNNIERKYHKYKYTAMETMCPNNYPYIELTCWK